MNIISYAFMLIMVAGLSMSWAINSNIENDDSNTVSQYVFDVQSISNNLQMIGYSRSNHSEISTTWSREGSPSITIFMDSKKITLVDANLSGLNIEELLSMPGFETTLVNSMKLSTEICIGQTGFYFRYIFGDNARPVNDFLSSCAKSNETADVIGRIVKEKHTKYRYLIIDKKLDNIRLRIEIGTTSNLIEIDYE